MVEEIWSELDPRLISGKYGEISKVINIDAVKASIENILLTSFGERVMLPEFGSPLKGLLFENMLSEEINQVLSSLQTIIQTWDDRLQISEMTIFREPDRHIIWLEVLFRIRGHDQVFQIKIPTNSQVIGEFE